MSQPAEQMIDPFPRHLMAQDQREPIEILVSDRLVAWIFENPELKRIWWRKEGGPTRNISAKISLYGGNFQRRYVHLDKDQLIALIDARADEVIPVSWSPVPGRIHSDTRHIWVYQLASVNTSSRLVGIPKRLVVGTPEIGSTNIRVAHWFIVQNNLPITSAVEGVA